MFDWSTAEATGSFGCPTSEREAGVSPRVARVLIVDDREISRRICAAFCDLFNLECECVRSGAAAIEAMRQAHFDVVLMDIHMPGMSGVDAALGIRALAAPAGRVPIIAVTADASPAECAGYLAVGMADIVPKPITPSRLFKAITEAVGAERPAEPRSWAATAAAG